MPDIRISIITVCYNAAATIRRSIESVIQQDYPHIEYIIIDGASTDDTLHIVNEYREHINVMVSEPDRGLYDAMNKGIALASGSVVGILNADDFFISPAIISHIAKAFDTSGADIIYGNLNYVNPYGRIIRKWHAGGYKPDAFNRGWMPPHPTFYAKKSLYLQLGNYRLDYGTAADYELMLRFMYRKPLKVYYLDMTFLHMLTGGVSNKSYRSRVNTFRYDLKAMKANGIRLPYLTIILKPLIKVLQYV